MVVMCTSSSMKKVLPQMEAVLKLKVPIVSTTEELAYPTKGNMRYARAIHQLAKKAKVAVLGTGVNPGFVMDALPITLTGVCERVEALRIERVQDARIRRLPFQQKIGAGLTREQFQRKVDEGSVRHVGLAESVSMIADALGWKLDRSPTRSGRGSRPRRCRASSSPSTPGMCAASMQDGIGYRNGVPLITLHMEAYLGAPESFDSVEVDRVAGPQDEDRRRRPRRHRHGLDRRQLAAQDPRGRARPPHHARYADSVVLWRGEVGLGLGSWLRKSIEISVARFGSKSSR